MTSRRPALPSSGIALALIPARGRSRGLPGKNLAKIKSRTLIAIAVDTARETGRFDSVVVSSDDDGILAEASQAGATALRRPPHLATDDAKTIDVVRHALTAYSHVEFVVVLQPTSPLRTASDVEACLMTLSTQPEIPSVTTVTSLAHPSSWEMRVEKDGSLQPVHGWNNLHARRQDAVTSYRINGAVYAVRASVLESSENLIGPGTRAVVMPPERSVDIDSGYDLILARCLAERLEKS